MTNTPNDYLAIVLIGAGSSWFRAPAESAALRGVARRVRADWGRLFSLPKGQELQALLVDVGGHDNVAWDGNGIWAVEGETRTRISADRISQRTIRLA